MQWRSAFNISRVDKGEKYLLLRRFRTGYMDGCYSLVAGHVDGDETFAAAMAREAREEAGINVKIADLRLVHTMHRLADQERVSLFFQTSKWTGDVRNMEPDKCDDLAWRGLDEIRSPLVPYVEAALKSIEAGAAYSEFGWRQAGIGSTCVKVF